VGHGDRYDHGSVLLAGQPAHRTRIRPRDLAGKDVALIAVTALAAYCVVWITFYQLTLLSGQVGFILCWVGSFLVLYYVVNLLVSGRRVAADRAVAALITVGGLCLFTPLVLIVIYLFAKGARFLSFHLLVASQQGVEETCIPGFPCTKPGVLNALVGTAEQIGLATLIGVPAGVLTAVYLNEVGGRFTQAVRIIVTSMSGVPAILAGAFVYAFWITGFLHQGFSGFAGALALTVILLPTVCRGTEEVLRIVPNDLREASTALAAPQWRTVWSVVLPTARSGLVTAVLLAIAVALGETAPLLLTIFGSAALNVNPFNGPQMAMPLLVFQEVHKPLQSDINLAYAAALVLFLMVFTLFVVARVLSSDWLGNRVRASMNKRRSTKARAAREGGS
ncbi:MAG TPA: phosphate ABC transporter permease PstA, partial [Acidimicrobiales bacterium]|nr:phosphate ABC transporter permease PstA [Acidimicrobiales bacterium]